MPAGDIQDIKEMLHACVLEVCQECLPGGRRQGRLYVANNPVTGDYKKTPQTKVALDQDVGAWIDWRSNAKGDIFKLIEYTQGTDFKGAMTWARDFLGLEAMSFAERSRMRDQAKKRAVQQTEEADKARQWKLKKARQTFRAGDPLDANTPAARHVRAYLCARLGIDSLRDIPNFAWDSFRASPSQEWWNGAEWKVRDRKKIKVKNGPDFPCMLSAFKVPTGQITACHYTYLDPLSPKKAAVDPPKLQLGEAKGAAIWLTHGPEQKPISEAQEVHILGLFEGIETGLSMALEASDWRVCAGGSLSNMGNVPIDQPCISAVALGRDNNTGNEAAQAGFNRTLERLEDAGKPIHVFNPHFGDDFNDILKED